MLAQATDRHYELLREELKHNNEPGVWVGEMCRKLEVENPVIAEFLYRLLDRFNARPWFAYAVHCACAMYRLLEIAGTLPRVKPEVGAPMETEMFRNWRAFQITWIERLTTENPKGNTVIADYVVEYVAREGTEQEADYISWAGVVVYQYLVRQDEADELARLPLG